MDVSKFNCSEIFNDFRDSMEKCDFFALDQEMTGVNHLERPQLKTMCLNDLYAISREVVSRYVAFQLGVSIFKRVGDKYEVRAYNFFLLKDNGDFAVDTSALKFLLNNGMNFQKWLTTGMPYGDTNGGAPHRGKTPCALSLADILSNSLVKHIRKWYNDSPVCNDDCLTLRAIIYEEVEQLTLSKLRNERIYIAMEYDKSLSMGTSVLVTVRRMEPGALKEETTRLEDPTASETGMAEGFQPFWKCLIKYKKPLVGHNFWLDIMFLVQMHAGPLPDDYDAYKKLVNYHFPVIYDTKTLGRQLVKRSPLESFCLKDLYDRAIALNKSLPKPLEFISPPEFNLYNTEVDECSCKVHEAGFDSYITGITFCIIRHCCGSGGSIEVERWKNIISVFGSHFYMNVIGEDNLIVPSTFVIEFDKEVEAPLGELLLGNGVDGVEGVGDSTESGVRSLFCDYCKGNSKMMVVAFDSDIDEKGVRNLIGLCMERGKNLVAPIYVEEGVFPNVLNIYRLGT